VLEKKESLMTLSFIEENTASRRRLEVFVQRLSAGDLTRSTSYGWTTAALLAHLAFWDQRVLALLRRWQEQGVDSSPIDADAANEALKPLCHALEPGAAVELCLSSASAVDKALEALPAEFFERIQVQVAASPFQFRPNRALHRNAHLDDLERALGYA
jgi:hypothetical protein